MNKELIFLRTFAIACAVGFLFLVSFAFKTIGNQKFSEIDVERINIVEKDGTVKMIITNVDRFPTGKEQINKRLTNEMRKKYSGMLFFNEDGIECGGFIYDGKKMEKGHRAGLSLTFDQYDGDQVMQLLTQDQKEGDRRSVSTSLVFNDRAVNESQSKMGEIMKELDELGKKDPNAMQEKFKLYQQQGLIGGSPRIMLGKSRNQNNGLFLFDDKGKPKAMFYVDKNNQAKLDFFDENGKVVASFPDIKK